MALLQRMQGNDNREVKSKPPHCHYNLNVYMKEDNLPRKVFKKTVKTEDSDDYITVLK